MVSGYLIFSSLNLHQVHGFCKRISQCCNKKFLQIGAKGAEFIADMLKYNTTISVLDLRANGLRDEVCICGIVFFIPKNSSHVEFVF